MSTVSPSRRGPCCCVPGCSLGYGTDLSEVRTFEFPTNEEQRNAWIAAVRRDKWLPTESSHICSAHFVQGRPSSDPRHPDYVPSVFPHQAAGNVVPEMATFQCDKQKEAPNQACTAATHAPGPSGFDSGPVACAPGTDSSEAGLDTCHPSSKASNVEKRSMETQTNISIQDASPIMEENRVLRQRVIYLEQDPSAVSDKKLSS